jgi:Bacterial SH3 domain
LLLILSAIVCGAIYMVVTPPPVPERAQTETPSRTLAYQEKIARAAEEAKEEQAGASQASVPAPTPPAEEGQSAATPEAGTDASAPGPDATQMAGLPPAEDVPNDPNALPWQQPRSSNPQAGREMDGEMDDPTAPQRQAYGDPNDPRAPPPEAYGDPNDPRVPPPEAYDDPNAPMAPPPGPYGAGRSGPYGDPYDPRAPRGYGDPSGPTAGVPEDGPDPNAWPGRPGERPQEWVQVLVSGVGMRGTASEDAPVLFAFPYGRVLRVVSRYEDWVEVTDPQSAATGWMHARYLAPAADPAARRAAGPAYEDEPRRGRRWWRRHGNGFGGFIDRMLGDD